MRQCRNDGARASMAEGLMAYQGLLRFVRPGRCTNAFDNFTDRLDHGIGTIELNVVVRIFQADVPTLR